MKPWMSVGEVAEYLRFHRITIYRLLRDKKIPAVKLGGQWRFSSEVIEQMFGGKRPL